MKIEEILIKIRNSDNFEVKEPCGFPKIIGNHKIPEDVKKFYSLCGGINCYVKYGAFPLTILEPSKIKLANLALIGEQVETDISSSWYLIVDAEDGNFISIDFDSKRSGWCYESFEYSHGIKGNCPIIAKSFTELLMHIFSYSGDYFFWKDENIKQYGDAYDML